MNKKVRMFQALLIVAILLLQMIIPIVPSIAAGETITIQCKDKNFYNAIKEKLGEKVKSTSDEDLKLTALKSDVESIDTLDLSQDYKAEDAIKIEDISGIENFKGLTYLHLGNNKISDISELKGLTNLTELILSNNQVSDIRVLEGLTSLTYLVLSSNQIDDISALEGLTNLGYLYLENNQIGDIRALSGLTKLESLSLNNNQVSDIRVLEGLTSLTYLVLSSNQIDDISALEGLTNLGYLYLENNQIGDIRALSGLTKLESLSLNNNQISDLSELSGLTNLEYLYLSDSRITDIRVLSGLTNLTELSLWNNQISDISELKDLTNLTCLDLDNNQISDIGALSSLTNLTELYLSNNKITKNILKTEDEVELPQIFKAAKDQNSKVYTEEEYEFENCGLTTDKTKVKLKEKGQNASVEIMGGYASGTTLNIVVTEEAQKTLESIKITKQPTKLEYTEGESFDKAGMEVKACYSDKTETVITNYEITNGENLTKGQTSVTIKYTEGEKTVEATQAITVKAEDPNTEKTIQFKDENLYNAIKEKLGEKVKSASDKDLKLTALKSDVESINRLYLSQENGTADSAKITDISGIENFKGVNRLFLSNNQISNISALSELTNLTDLGLSNNKISDISALSGLANLTSLYLENNQISEINALSGLTKLTKLELSNNKINNISTLSNITSLKSLNLNSNEINDIKDLSDLTDLTNLHLANNKINDINTVSRLVNLTNLGLANNQISDISSLSTLVNLTYLNLSSNMISDISTLSGLTKLTDLNLTNQEITKNILKTEDEVELPQIFKATKEKNSKVYTEKEYEFQNCELTADKTKVKLKEKGQSATVKIVGGKAEGTTLNVVVTGETQKTLESIKITKQPTKLEYTEGESFDKAGMEVKACYSDKTETVITNYEITNGENLTKGQTSVTIKYTEGEKTVEATQAITVKAEDPNAEKTIQFKDENLYNEIKSILGDKIKDYNDEELTIKAIKKDIEEINSIGPLREVDDISGIGNFTGLESLSLIDNNLSDISEVEKLTNLTHFSISHTQVEDIKAISKLTNLKILNIEASKVTDISGLKDLVNLNELYLIQNDIKNIDVIKNFKNLQILKARENQISDISAVAGLSNLRSLWIADNQISDANPIQKLPNLKYYGLENQQVTKYILKTQKEVELPPIFTQAKDKNSKIYTEKEYEFINCKLNEDGTKVILTTVGENATVKISGGKADGTTLNIIAVDEIPKELTSIEIAIHPGKFIYTEGEDFDTTGLKVEAKYSDGSSKELKEGEYEIVDGKNLKLGQETVTIRYTEGEKTVETTQKVGVTAKTPEEQKTLESIKITTAPTKTKYTEGEKFDKKGMKVIATYSDGTTKEVTDYTYTPAGELKTTDKTITVSYKEGEKTVEAKYTITVKAKPPVAQKTLESIKITVAPTKTTYTEGEKFDKKGMKVTATYSDKTEKEVTDYTYTPAGELKTTDTAITVSYTENELTKTATQEITVVAKGNSGDEPGGETEKAKLDSIEIKEAPTKTVYTEGEKFDKTGMKVIAKYSDGTTKEIKNYAYTPAGELKTTDKTITVSYTENGVTKTDTQKIKIQNKDDGTGAKDKFPDTGAQIPIISGIVLMFAVAVASVVKIKRLTGI